MNIKSKIKINMYRFILGIKLAILINSTAFAGIETLIKNVMPTGTMSNVSTSEVVKEQAAGHYMGGSVIMKSPPIKGIHLGRVQAPSCKIGGLPCGANFELIGGGISILSKEELLRQLKSLPQFAKLYAAKMAIKTISPICNDIQEFLDAKADMMNDMANMDCRDMEKQMDGMMSKIWSKERGIRQANTSLKGGDADMVELQDNSKKEKKEALDPELAKSQLGDNYNLVWKALNKKRKFSNDKDGKLREMLMSISGTIIGKKEIIDAETVNRTVKHLKPLASKELIKEFIGTNARSSDVELYVCDIDKVTKQKTTCLNPEKTKIKIGSRSMLFNKIQELLKSITRKIEDNRNNEVLTGDEEALVALSTVPLISKIEMDLASYSNRANVVANQTEFVEALCYDVVISYFQSLLIEVEEAVGEFEHSQLADGKIFNDFTTECRQTMRMLSTARIEAFKRYDIIAQTKARLRQDQKHFEKQFESHMQNHNKGR